jgi:cytochrome c
MDLPVPHDIPLGLPAPAGVLAVLLVVSFLAHILFVNLMLGGSLLTLISELRGLRRKEMDALAHEISRTITVNKSMAVVLGVAPLLVMNALYTVYFYSANALTGTAWILIVPLVIVAFLLSYAHEYSWSLLAERKGLHLLLCFSSFAIFAFIPLVFLANINLMLYPDRWPGVSGFLSALLLPNVLPRYFHFLTASVAVASLFFVWYFGHSRFPHREALEPLGRDDLKRYFYSLALGATALQLFFGPLLYLTLPGHTKSWLMTGVITCGALLATLALWWMWLETRDKDGQVGRRFVPVVAVLTLTVVFMATGRHMVRENAVAPHRALMVQKTAHYQAQVHGTQDFVLIPGGLGGGDLSPGESLFRKSCSSCHATDTRLVGPPLAEIVPIYENNPDGIVAWAKAPGRSRADYPPMPAQNLPVDDLKAIAEYILDLPAG